MSRPSTPIHELYSFVVAFVCVGILLAGNLFMPRSTVLMFAALAWLLGVVMSAKVRLYSRRVQREFFKASNNKENDR